MLLEKREKELLQMKKEKEKALKAAPDGTLRLCRYGDKVQYYHRTDAKDTNGVYLKEKDVKLVAKLAQKDYDRKALKAIEKELCAISRYKASYPHTCVENIYEHLHKDRKKLVMPVYESDEEFISNWEQVTYQGKEFYEDTPLLYTEKNERVRSKSEVMIADMLHREKIPYRYEYPVLLQGLGTIYPDFTVLDIRRRKTMLWEHLGMMDDPDYAELALQKIAAYEQNGIFPGEDLILTYETRRFPLNSKTIQTQISHYLK